MRPSVETIVEKGWGKQAESQGKAGSELLDDLPWGEASFVGVGTSQIEVELVEGNLGEEVGAVLESFQVEELVFDQAVDGFDVALEGVRGGRDALVLGAEVGDGARKVGAGAVGLEFADEFAAVVGLPSHVTQGDAAARQVAEAGRPGWTINFLMFGGVYVIATFLWLRFDSTKPVVPDERPDSESG